MTDTATRSLKVLLRTQPHAPECKETYDRHGRYDSACLCDACLCNGECWDALHSKEGMALAEGDYFETEGGF